MRAFIFVGIVALFAAHCSKPTIRELDGKIKGKASLRLADGSTISRDDSEEYHPQIVRLSDGYLVLVFGSDRTCSGCDPFAHNIFVAKSLTPYDGMFLPYFDTPLPLRDELNNALNAPGAIDFAVVPNGAGVNVYFNDFNTSYQIKKANITDFVTVNPSWVAIANSTYADHTVIGANAAGDRLVTTDFSGQAYIISPDVSVASDPYGFGLDNTSSAIQIRQETSGSNDAYIASIYGGTMATTADYPLGPVFQFDTSLIFSGLFLNTLGAFYSDNAYGDLVLFSAYDMFTGSEDMYVVTSHTAGDLWGLVGYFGFDVVMPPAPAPDHFYTFDGGTCGVDEIAAAWPGTCSAVTVDTTVTLNGTDYADLPGSSYMNLGPQTLASDFTLSAWVHLPGTPTGQHVIVSNVGSTANADGFRLYVDASDSMKLKFDVGDNLATASIASYQFALMADTWHHVAVAVNSTMQMAYLYVDGAIVNEINFTWIPTIAAFNTTSSNIYWGARTDATSGLVGYMDSVRIHQRELSPMEIMAEMMEF